MKTYLCIGKSKEEKVNDLTNKKSRNNPHSDKTEMRKVE